MTRAVEEWIGKNDDIRIPDRVKLRVFLRFDGRCQCGCNRTIRPGEKWQCDHKVAIANGGEHRERNLQPLLVEHHKTKTRKDIAEKAATYERRLTHAGIKRKSKGRPMPGTKASGIRRRMDGRVERWT